MNFRNLNEEDIDSYLTTLLRLGRELSSDDLKSVLGLLRETQNEDLRLKCSSLCAPIRKLLPELLSKILILAVTPTLFQRRPLGPRYDFSAPAISLVSFHWRQVCLSTPLLWANLDFEFDGHYSKGAVKHVLRHLRRSGVVPLTLSFEVNGIGPQRPIQRKTHMKFLDPLFKQSDRWSVLSLVGTDEGMAGFLPLLEGLSLSNVTTFVADLGINTLSGQSINLLNFLQGKCPNLCSFSNLGHYDASWYTLSPISFHTLCHLKVCGFNVETVVEAMRRCGSSLESLEMVVACLDIGPLVIDRVTYLSSLRTFSIKYVAQSELIPDIGPHASSILGTISAPSLQSFTIETKGYDRCGPLPVVESSLLSGIKDFFGRSKFQLRRFCLIGVICTTHDLLEALEVMNGLQELVLHEVTPAYSSAYGPYLNELVTTELIKSLTIDLDGDVLLPQLRHLELRIFHGWEEDLFERMLESRCGNSLTSVYVAGVCPVRRPFEREDFLVDIERLGKLDLALRVPEILEYEVVKG